MFNLFQKLVAVVEGLVIAITSLFAVAPVVTPVFSPTVEVAEVATTNGATPTPVFSVAPKPSLSPTPTLNPTEKLFQELKELKEQIAAYTPEPTPSPIIIYITAPTPTPIPRPTIQYFKSDKTTAYLGDEITFNWSSVNAITCGITYKSVDTSVPVQGLSWPSIGEYKEIIRKTDDLKPPTFQYFLICANKSGYAEVAVLAVNILTKPIPTPTPIPERFTYNGSSFFNATNTVQRVKQLNLTLNLRMGGYVFIPGTVFVIMREFIGEVVNREWRVNTNDFEIISSDSGGTIYLIKIPMDEEIQPNQRKEFNLYSIFNGISYYPDSLELESGFKAEYGQ